MSGNGLSGPAAFRPPAQLLCWTNQTSARSVRNVDIKLTKTNEQTDKTLVQAFVSSRLDYCNCLLIGLMRRLEAVQNATARLITGTRRRDHITTILRQLHWLPVRQRAEFKLAMLVFKSTRFSPTVPGRRLSTRRCLRSTSTTIVKRQYLSHSMHPHSSR